MPPRFMKREAPTPSPSFNRGWRLGVCFGAAFVLLLVFAALGLITIGVLS